MLRNVFAFIKRNVIARLPNWPLNEIENNFIIDRVVSRVSCLCKACIRGCRKLKLRYTRMWETVETWSRFRFDTGVATIDDLANHSETYDWKTTTIRFVACHPTGEQRAFLTCEDEGLVYADMLVRPNYLVSPRQLNVVCAAFRPWEGVHLAIGSEGGICLWKISRAGRKNMTWLEYREEEYVIDLQWLQMGSLLASATLGNQRVQIWHPELKQLLQEIYMPALGTNCWALRHPLDMMFVIDFLKVPSVLLSFRNSMEMLSTQLIQRMPLQTAAWTSQGNHLLYVIKSSTKVLGATSTLQVGAFRQEYLTWSSKEIIDLSSFSCPIEEYDGGQVLSMAMDPMNVYVAFTFIQQPFVLLCLLHIPFGCSVKLKPMQIIRCPDEIASARASCIAFGNVRREEKHVERSLVICWSSTHVQIDKFTAMSREEALQQEEDQVPLERILYQISFS